MFRFLKGAAASKTQEKVTAAVVINATWSFSLFNGSNNAIHCSILDTTHRLILVVLLLCYLFLEDCFINMPPRLGTGCFLETDIQEKDEKQSQKQPNQARDGKDKVKSKPKSEKVKSQPNEENTT
ncbi:hypothetical protein Tco_0990994 [Tanacetum coccineum]|uniref:Uncharacterized protein n=1 Tax=Tanacetum coccineum TaxID=301880 RepID=A0ABQ5EYB4_9ASTR